MSDGNFTNTIPRNRWDQPLIYPPPARGKMHADVVASKSAQHKPKGYRRTTKFIGVLEDRYNLENWSQRMVALGVASEPSVVGRLSELGPDDKDEVDGLVRVARDSMRTGLKASLGSYLHHCTELKDLHGDDTDLPSPADWASFQKGNVDLRDDDYPLDLRDDDVNAYLSMKKRYGLTFSAIEQMRVFDPWKIAGTPDRIGTGTDERFGGKWMIEDVKTGDIDWANKQREIAMQLAMYAHSTAYTHDDGRIDDIPPVDRQKAVVIHLPVMEGRCELHFVDLTAGWEGCQHAQAVWEWRKRKNVFTKIDDWEPVNHLEKLAMRPSFAEAAMTCGTKDDLRTLWVNASNVPGALSDSFKAAVQKRLEQLDGAA